MSSLRFKKKSKKHKKIKNKKDALGVSVRTKRKYNKNEHVDSDGIELYAVIFFIFATSLMVFFSKYVGIAFLYVPGYEIHDFFLYNRSVSVILVENTIILALFSYSFVISYKFLTKVDQPSYSKEIISDIMMSREQFRKLYENSPVPYFLIDDIGNIHNPNVATLRFFKGTLEQCTSANFYSLISDDENTKRGLSLIRTKVERSVPVTKEELSVKTIDGKEEKYALVSIYSMEKTSHIPFKHLITLIDITSEKENERAKTDFLLLASHQLRTPLTTVKWYIDYLLTSNEKITDNVREYLEQIYVGNERMIELITTLLTVSRIEMGVLAPEYISLKVDEVVNDVLEELDTDIKKKNIKIKKELSGNDELVTDHTMIRIIIHNLLTNAIKYTPSGGNVFITMKFDIYNCEISVTDTGYGIPDDEKDKIFTKMFRASNARKVSANGTGLGLYMSKSFVEKLGGKINFESKEKKGTTFTVLLPKVAPGA